jgi:hypothetical protein
VAFDGPGPITAGPAQQYRDGSPYFEIDVATGHPDRLIVYWLPEDGLVPPGSDPYPYAREAVDNWVRAVHLPLLERMRFAMDAIPCERIVLDAGWDTWDLRFCVASGRLFEISASFDGRDPEIRIEVERYFASFRFSPIP